MSSPFLCDSWSAQPENRSEEGDEELFHDPIGLFGFSSDVPLPSPFSLMHRIPRSLDFRAINKAIREETEDVEAEEDLHRELPSFLCLSRFQGVAPSDCCKAKSIERARKKERNCERTLQLTREETPEPEPEAAAVPLGFDEVGIQVFPEDLQM